MERKIIVNGTPSFQLLSDIHLEHRRKGFRPPDTTSSILILAGDIGRPSKGYFTRFIEEVTSHYQYVLLVAGNHEYYGSSIDTTEETLREFERRYPNLLFLQNRSILLSFEQEGSVREYRVYGTTLWSRLDPGVETNDHQRIHHFTPSHTNSLHREMVAGIERVLKESDRPLIIITHHLPSYSLISPHYQRRSDREMNSAYASSLEDLFRPPLVLWVHGHSHQPHRTVLKGIPVVSNPVGYPLERIEFSLEPIFL